MSAPQSTGPQRVLKRKKSRNKKGVKRILTIFGYFEVFEPTHPLAKRNGYVREHRMIAWDAGILTNKNDVVHHKNGIKTDNRPENLEAVPNSKHTSLHWKGAKRKPTKERRERHSRQMMNNTNWKGNHSNPELLQP